MPLSDRWKRLFGNLWAKFAEIDLSTSDTSEDEEKSNETEESSEDTSTDETSEWGLEKTSWPWDVSCMDTVSTGDELLEIAIFHYQNPEAAEITAEYVRGAIVEGWKDDYDLQVEVHEVDENIRTMDDWGNYFYHEMSSDEKAKDANHLLADSGEVYSVPSYSISPVRNIHALYGDCARCYGMGDAHYYVNMALHEIGHSLEFDHSFGEVVKETIYQNGQEVEANHVTPMQTSYTEGTRWTHRFSDRCKEKGITTE